MNQIKFNDPNGLHAGNESQLHRAPSTIPATNRTAANFDTSSRHFVYDPVNVTVLSPLSLRFCTTAINYGTICSTSFTAAAPLHQTRLVDLGPHIAVSLHAVTFRTCLCLPARKFQMQIPFHSLMVGA